MRQPLVAGNWKMNGSRDFTHALVSELLGGGAGSSSAEVVIFPPYPYLAQVADLLDGAGAPALGAQDLHAADAGAHTGDVSAAMLVDVGCRYVIVGHSERRADHGEDSALVARKARAALSASLLPIACVGETLADREADRTEAVIGEQLDALLAIVGSEGMSRVVLAYEPVWAIGTGRTATPDQAQAVHAFLRQRLAAADPALASKVRILYGGSVKPDNAAALFAEPDIDGGLIGGASLKATDFLAICNASG